MEGIGGREGEGAKKVLTYRAGSKLEVRAHVFGSPCAFTQKAGFLAPNERERERRGETERDFQLSPFQADDVSSLSLSLSPLSPLSLLSLSLSRTTQKEGKGAPKLMWKLLMQQHTVLERERLVSLSL